MTGELPTHDDWMALALEEAALGAREGEVPVGAVLVQNGRLLARDHNAPIGCSDPTAHAEIRVLRRASAEAANYRVPGSILYVTIEPCPMCVGALVHARVDTVVFGAREPRAGALVSQERLDDKVWLNHRPKVIEGVQAGPAADLIRTFFRARRAAAKL